MRPATRRIPKSLIEINGEPFLAHQLRLLYRSGLQRVTLCVGYLGEMVEFEDLVLKNLRSFEGWS